MLKWTSVHWIQAIDLETPLKDLSRRCLVNEGTVVWSLWTLHEQDNWVMMLLFVRDIPAKKIRVGTYYGQLSSVADIQQ